ncbi:UDP-N-acetylmuramate dehydrogenase [bacterium]|nr:UDP-N-acetylmuramate dehydrogenase [bacterium]
MSHNLQQQLNKLGIAFSEGVPLARYTSLKVGGAADLLVNPTTAVQVAELLKLAEDNSLPVLKVGRGTNLLIGDRGFRGLVMLLDEKLLDGRFEIEGESCLASAGLKLSKVVKQLCSAGLGGLENLYGIPGSLGGALAMNAGSYGSTIMPAVEEVELALPSGEVIWLNGSEIDYGYRRVALPPGAVITQAKLRLQLTNSDELLEICKARQADREAKHPLTKPNCGSVFKNPTNKNPTNKNPDGEHGAWWLVNEAGLKGFTIGGAKVSTKHTNFIINTGNATAADVLALILHIQKTVQERFSIELETEVRRAGEFQS